MLTTQRLQQVVPDAEIRPAADIQRPATGEFVRTTTCPRGTLSMTDHRDLYIESATIELDGRTCLRTMCIMEQGIVRGTTYAGADGLFVQFRPAAPAGPYASAKEQDHWRAGYSDALEFVSSNERFIAPSQEYLAGLMAGRAARVTVAPAPWPVASAMNPMGYGHRRTTAYCNRSMGVAA